MTDARASGEHLLHPADQQLLNLSIDDDTGTRLSLIIEPHLSRSDGRFYGGAAMAVALAAGEIATGVPALWATNQLVAPAPMGSRIDIVTDVVAAGRSANQVHVQGFVDDHLIFNSVGSTARGRAGGIAATGQPMPRVPDPAECPRWVGPGIEGEIDLAAFEPPTVGHQLVSEYLGAPLLDADPARPGHMALWARLAGDHARDTGPLTAASLGFLADMVPIAVCRAAGVVGAGTSLDNTLRIGDIDVDHPEWLLLELDAEVAVGGFGHGTVRIWTPDGHLLATGAQSARLFSIADFISRNR